MKLNPQFLAIAALCGFSQGLVAQAPPSASAPAVAPLPPQAPDVAAQKMDPKTGEVNASFLSSHNRFVETAKKNESRLLFLGDSITAGWWGQKEIWNTAFGAFEPANFGIGGDRTQHVLWRITNGELDGFTPKVLVLMIGTNNSGQDSAEGIALGVTKIVEAIQAKTPATKVLLLAVFPRGEKPNPTRDKLKDVNARIAKLDNQKNVFFLDIGDKFLEADGTLTKEVMPDFLHLSPKGYQIWADAIAPSLGKLMK